MPWRDLLWMMMLVVVCSLFPQATLAHDGHEHGEGDHANAPVSPSARTWTIAKTNTTEYGSFVMARAGQIQIRRNDASLVTIPIAALSDDDQHLVEHRLEQIRARVASPLLMASAREFIPEPQPIDKPTPLIAEHFDPFVKLKAIRTRWDDFYLYVESNGIPAHPMMVGIRSWQQQVPIPQKYTGDNAWRIPLRPVPAAEPATTKNRFLRGAIALAANGIPIFNPLNNRGDDAYLFGELDEYGGHCGRADDYHYHLAPTHLQEAVGKGKPIGYALDGYPIYGFQGQDGIDSAPLDRLNGHKDAQGNYHYHATKTYPYLNGGFYGVVTEKDGQVDPQPRAEPLRPALSPLRDAKIIGFEEVKPGSYRLTYDVLGRKGTVSYTLGENGSTTFEFVDPSGRKTTETYNANRRGPGGPPPRPRDDRPPQPDDRQRPRGDRPPQRGPAAKTAHSNLPQLGLSSRSVDARGLLSVDCTCDGKAQTPAIAWENAPADTKFFAVSLWHTAPDQEKSYWLIYNIPAQTTGIAQNAKPDGTIGLNDRRRAEYDPMCSKGPGLKTYHVTVFALAQKIDLDPKNATRATLLKAIEGKVLAEGTLDFQYERK